MESNRDGHYVRLEDEEDVDSHARNAPPPDVPTSSETSWRWGVKEIGLCILAVVSAVIIVNWLGPPLMKKVVIPTINWVTRSFDPPILALLIFASTALFPALFVPSTPSMWIAGMSFSYVTGFAIVMAGVTIGITLPYFIGTLFRQNIQRCLARYPKQASLLRLADVEYSPYLLASLVGIAPEVLLTLYSGKLIRKLADVAADHKGLSKPHTVVNLVGFGVSLIATLMSSLYAKGRLEKQRRKEELTLG